MHWKGREGKRSTTTTSWVAGERLNPTLNEHEWTNSNGTYEKKHWKVVIIQRHRLLLSLFQLERSKNHHKRWSHTCICIKVRHIYYLMSIIRLFCMKNYSILLYALRSISLDNLGFRFLSQRKKHQQIWDLSRWSKLYVWLILNRKMFLQHTKVLEVKKMWNCFVAQQKKRWWWL